MVSDFMDRARRMLALGVSDERLRDIAQLLADAAREPGFVTESDMRALHGGDATFTT